MRKRAGALAATLATVATLGGAVSASAAEITIKPSNDEQVFHSPGISISGKLSPDRGTAASGHEVALIETRYPYKRSRVIATDTTGDKGDYRFGDVRPPFNTRYRVASTSPGAKARSKSKFIVVLPVTKLRVEVEPGRVEGTFLWTQAKDLPLDLSGRKAFWYFNREGTKSFDVIDTSRAQQRGGNIRVRNTFAIAEGRYRFSVAVCVDLPDRRDIGVGQPGTARDCPRTYERTRRAGRVGAATPASPLPAKLLSR